MFQHLPTIRCGSCIKLAVCKWLAGAVGCDTRSLNQINVTVTVTWSRPSHLDTPERSQQGSWGIDFKVHCYICNNEFTEEFMPAIHRKSLGLVVVQGGFGEAGFAEVGTGSQEPLVGPAHRAVPIAEGNPQTLTPSPVSQSPPIGLGHRGA
jgi:hypothetical protein